MSARLVSARLVSARLVSARLVSAWLGCARLGSARFSFFGCNHKHGNSFERTNSFYNPS